MLPPPYFLPIVHNLDICFHSMKFLGPCLASWRACSCQTKFSVFLSPMLTSGFWVSPLSFCMTFTALDRGGLTSRIGLSSSWFGVLTLLIGPIIAERILQHSSDHHCDCSIGVEATMVLLGYDHSVYQNINCYCIFSFFHSQELQSQLMHTVKAKTKAQLKVARVVI